MKQHRGKYSYVYERLFRSVQKEMTSVWEGHPWRFQSFFGGRFFSQNWHFGITKRITKHNFLVLQSTNLYFISNEDHTFEKKNVSFLLVTSTLSTNYFIHTNSQHAFQKCIWEMAWILFQLKHTLFNKVLSMGLALLPVSFFLHYLIDHHLYDASSQ